MIPSRDIAADRRRIAVYPSCSSMALTSAPIGTTNSSIAPRNRCTVEPFTVTRVEGNHGAIFAAWPGESARGIETRHYVMEHKAKVRPHRCGLRKKPPLIAQSGALKPGGVRKINPTAFDPYTPAH
jgi:hypothetical protein